MKTCISILTVVLVAFTGPAFARQVPIDGTHSRDEIRRICKEQGGDFSGNLDHYKCAKSNCDGQGGTCIVVCDPDGRCFGQVPKKVLSSLGGLRVSPRTVLKD